MTPIGKPASRPRRKQGQLGATLLFTSQAAIVAGFFLANEAEHRTWPLFREHYERWVSRAARGEILKGPERVRIAPPDDEPPSTEEQITQLAQLRREIGL